MHNKTKVAVLLSTYNGEKYIAEQLDSLLNQDYPHFEVYIRDDGSKDGTVVMIEEYVARYPKMFHKVESDGQNLGAIKSFLSLMRSVDSDYYLFCDQDDIWFSNKISESINTLVELENHTSGDQPCCIFTNAKVSDAGGKNIIDDDLWHYVSTTHKCVDNVYDYIVNNNPAYGCTLAFNKVARDITLKISEKMKNSGIFHDEIVCFVCVNKGKVAFIQTPMMIYRRTGNNVTDTHNIALVARQKRLSGSLWGRVFAAVKAFRWRIRKLHALSVKHIDYIKLLRAFWQRYHREKVISGSISDASR